MPVTLTINNSHTSIHDLDEEFEEELSNLLSYPIPGAHFTNLPWYLKRKFLLKKKGGVLTLPTGLLTIVFDFFKEHKIIYDTKDNRKAPASYGSLRIFNKTQSKLRPYQEAIVERCLTSQRGVVEAATGTGKTRIIIELVKRFCLTTLIIVPSTQILYQFYELLVATFGKKVVGRIGDGKSEYKAQITIANIQALEKVPDSFWQRQDVLIIDEFHHSAAETYQQLNNKKFLNIYHRFGFTGTNFRNDGTDLALQGVLSDVLYTYNAIDAINDGYLCSPIFCFYDVHHNALVSSATWKEEYDRCIINNDSFDLSVSSLASKLIKQGLPTIVFVKEIDHGQKLTNLIPGSVFINGEQSSQHNKQALEDFNEGKVMCIVGTSVIGEGVDTVKAACGIMAGGGKARSEVIQKIGRLLRPHPDKKFAMVIDFMHRDTKWCLRHSKLREKVYKEYGCDIIYNNIV